MCGLQAENNVELSDLVAVVVCCWTSFRAEDLHGLLSKNVAKVSMTNTAPRMWKFYLERMKNDPLGQGPVHDREFMVPCICIEGMKNTALPRGFFLVSHVHSLCPPPKREKLKLLSK